MCFLRKTSPFAPLSLRFLCSATPVQRYSSMTLYHFHLRLLQIASLLLAYIYICTSCHGNSLFHMAEWLIYSSKYHFTEEAYSIKRSIVLFIIIVSSFRKCKKFCTCHDTMQHYIGLQSVTAERVWLSGDLICACGR